MTSFIDFHVGLHRHRDEGVYGVDVMVKEPAANSAVHPDTHPVKIEMAELLALTEDYVAYGKLLTRLLIDEAGVGAALKRARDIADSNQGSVRFRLHFDESASELHALRWETLRDPDDRESALLTSDKVLFSRYVASHRPPPRQPRPVSAMKALVVIANPSDLGSLLIPLSAIDVEAETAAANKRLKLFEVTSLISNGTATFKNMMAKLREERFDLLYLVCHGYDLYGEPRLVLEMENGKAEVVDGDVMIRQFHQITAPRMVVLASCYSGGASQTASSTALARLGPRLAFDIGIPAVIAMQGEISVPTASQFLTTYFENVSQHGEVDRAVSAARAAVAGRTDWWVPVLYMRVTNGKIWIDPGPDGRIGPPHFGKWEGLLQHIRNGICTPIIGFGVYESIFGREDMLAYRWAEAYGYPFQNDRRDELPQIAQYISVAQNETYPSDILQGYFRNEIHSRFGLGNGQETQTALDELITTAWREHALANDPYRVLAQLQCKLYLTTNIASTMETALADVGVNAISRTCKWNDDIVEPGELPQQFDPEKPVVFHLFGQLSNPYSIVITEDNYFDYLMAAGTEKKDPMIPQPIRTLMNRSSLLFLGFDITNWNFRVLFRSLLNPGGLIHRKRFTHAAVQVDPKVSDPDLVLGYLDRYIGRQNITIFNGSLETFVERLIAEWKREFKEDLLTRRKP